MKDKLLKLLKAKQEARTAKVKLVDASSDVNELRNLQKEIDGINEEIRSIQAMIDELPDETNETKEEERTTAVNTGVPGVVTAGVEQKKAADDDEMEYRKAFQQFVTKGTSIPAELRGGEVTKTTDITAAIPTVLVNKIIEKMEATGMILPLVTKTSFPAGMNIPVSSVKPIATWVLEGAGSDKQKASITSAITFTHFKLRCEIAMTMESSVMAISAFEAAFVRQVVQAMVKSIEQAIIDGAGVTGPKGILKEIPAVGQNINIAKADKLTYKTLTDSEAALPMAYENGAIWFMTKKTFMEFISMTDTAGQPIARVNYGIGGRPERTLLGRTVILNDYMASYESAPAADKIVAFLFNPDDYTLNTNYNMGVQRKQDWDTEDLLTKAVMAVDGKVIDKNSLVTITKKSV